MIDPTIPTASYDDLDNGCREVGDLDVAGDLHHLLNRTEEFISRYVALPSSAALSACTLWAAHTWAIDAFQSTPRLLIKSAEKQSGKTRLQEVLELVVARPRAAANVTTPALFRMIGDDDPPTILLDEIDTIFGKNAPEGSEDLRGLINAGHRRGRPVIRCQGPTHEPREFASFAPMVLGGIGSAPDTVEDRSVIIVMRRRAPDEVVASFRQRTAEAEAEPIKTGFVNISKAMTTALDEFYPELPDWLTDRPADVYEPLIAVADVAGGDWPDRARRAAQVLLAERDAGDDSIGVRLLGDIRIVFADDVHVMTDELLDRLRRLEESPWSDWDISPRWLANYLKPYNVTSKNIRDGGRQAKGYVRGAFDDAWSRYLPGVPSQASQAYDQGERSTDAVPGTDVAVPESHPQGSDQGWDGGTDGTQVREGGR